MKLLLMTLAALSFAHPAFAEKNINDHGDYRTTCKIRNGVATASLESSSWPVEVDGKFVLKMYDWGGSMVHKSKKRFVTRLNAHEETTIFGEKAPWDAHTCELVAKQNAVTVHVPERKTVEYHHVYRYPEPRQNTVVIHKYEEPRRHTNKHIVIRTERNHPRTRVRGQRQEQRQQRTKVEINLPTIKAKF